MDAQFFTSETPEPAEDPVQVEAKGEDEKKDLSQVSSTLNSIEEDALGKAGFVPLPSAASSELATVQPKKQATVAKKANEPKKTQRTVMKATPLVTTKKPASA